MKIDKVISRLASASSGLGDRAELRRVARALGNELPRNRVDTLREFRARLACVRIGADTAPRIEAVSYATGYVAGLADVSAEYEVTVAEDATEDAAEDADALSADVARGIRLAVELFRHATQGLPGTSLQAVAARALGDAEAAAQAVALWQSESTGAGLVPAAAREHADQVTARSGAPTAEPEPLLMWEANTR